VPVDFPTGEAERMAAWLERVKPDEPGVRVTHHLLRGDPAPEIVPWAGEAKADLIVMGTHGRDGLPRLVPGSVAGGVMRHAPCPVVTVRPPPAAVRASPPAPRVRRRVTA
jgi:nucleotide-binding universal stress UspA family protein